MTDLAGLIEKHRANGLLIDTNVFVLYLVGKTNESRIARFDRTQSYTAGDFTILDRLVAQFRTIVTTPHVLTEVSNLAKLHGREMERLRSKFREIVQRSQELYEESRGLMTDAAFPRLGLTDAAIAVVSQRKMLVVTDDLDLYVTLEKRGVDAVNFNHIRTYAW